MNWTTQGQYWYPLYHHQMSSQRSRSLEAAPATTSRYRLVLVEHGTGALMAGDVCLPVVAPALICLNEKEPLQLMEGTELTGCSVYYHPLVINEKFGFHIPDEEKEALNVTEKQDLWCLLPFRDRSGGFVGLLPIDPIYARHISQLMTDIDGQLSEQPDQSWPCRSRSYLMELLSLVRRLYDHAVKADKPSPQSPNLASDLGPIIQFLHTNYRNKIKVEDLARAFHTNKTTLNLKFKELLGTTMSAYLNSIRMQMAATMLRNTTLPVSEIMFMVGIQDSGHFNRQFRRDVGMTPIAYRHAYCWMIKKK